MRQPDAQRIRRLERAFAQFNETSLQLQSSWSALQQQVAELTRERDAAQQARLQELAARERLADRLQTLLAALPGAALMIDADGCVRECNVGAQELLGQPLQGEAWCDVATRALHARSDADGTPCLADGRHLAVSRRATADGGCVLLLTDDSEAHARRRGVQQQRQRADHDEQQARLAHQLRTPLATAVLYVSRLASGGLDAGAARGMAGKALARLVDLQCLIDQTLALARGTTGTSESVAVADLLRETLENLAGRGASRVRVEAADASVGASVHGQRSLLVSALVALLDNAAGFASTARLEATRSGANVLVSVHDNGPGVSAHAAPRIFEPFFTTRAGGTGLGLAMARTIARAHGGELRLVPAAGGACFQLQLPLAGNSAPLASDISPLAVATPRRGVSRPRRKGKSP